MNKVVVSLFILLLICSSSFSQEKQLTISEFVSILKSSQNPQILDARSPEEYALNHIKGAINVNLKDSVATEKLIKSLDRKSPSFTYSINNGRSGALARKLKSRGFEQVYELPGGLANWVGSGNALESFNNKGLIISSEQFAQLSKSNELVLVDFGSKFCGGCRKLVPVLDSLEKIQASNLKVIRIEMYENPDLVKEQKIKSLPTLVLFKNGEIIWRNEGNINYNQLLSAIQSKSKLLANK